MSNSFLLQFDVSDLSKNELHPVSVFEADQQLGQAVMPSAETTLFTVTTPPTETALTIAITYYDDNATFASFAYCDHSGRPHRLNIDRCGDGEMVTATFPLADADLSRTLPDTAACLAFHHLTIRRIVITAGMADDLAAPAPAFAPQTAQNDLSGKGVAGYQVWFRAGERSDSWFHWGRMHEGRISPAHELYPAVDEYRADNVILHKNGQAPLGNGTPAEVFTSTDEGVIDTHFRWMQDYDIDGAAVQRFFSCSSPSRQTGRSTLRLIADRAEKYNRLFYVMYDFSGCGQQDPDFFLRNVQLDFIFNAEETGVATSSAYAHLNGRPVVCFWGISGDPKSRYIYGKTASALIDWFHARGYSVIVGTPDNGYATREGELLAPFLAADMLSPWTVGRYGPGSAESWLNRVVPGDLAFCEAHGIRYQPVLFAGFAWTNLGNRGGINEIPHNAGQFLWTQAYQLAQFGVHDLYFAMFDEYDEGTALMKAACDYFEIPTDQYYLTYAADGLWLSNDYYLRAAGAAIDMIQDKAPLREHIDIPHSQGPVFWRNSFEQRGTAFKLHTGERRFGNGALDVCLYHPELLTGTPRFTTAHISDAEAKSGHYSLHFAGQGETVFRIAETSITTDWPLQLTYALLATNEGGRSVKLDLQFADGSRTDLDVPAGTVGKWITVKVPILPHDRITAVLISGTAADFDAFVDDIVLEAE